MKNAFSFIWFASNTRLSSRQIFLFYLIALFLFCYPIIINNYYFYDDNLRTLHASTTWYKEGRVIADYIYNIVSVTSGQPNIFPLSMFIAILVMSIALTRLACHWFITPVLSQCLILLPLWYNPFSLQLLSYQYDCLTATISFAIVISTITLNHKTSISQIITTAVMIFVSLGIYQLSLQIYAGLAALDILYRQSQLVKCNQLMRRIIIYVLSLIIGYLIYHLTIYTMVTDHRGGFIIPNASEILQRIDFISRKIILFITPANVIIFSGLLIFSLAGLFFAIFWQEIKPARTMLIHRILICIITLTITIISIPGILLFTKNFILNSSARMLIGTGTLLTMMLLYSYLFLNKINTRCTLLNTVPLFVMLSFSYSYGNFMHQKKINENRLIQLFFSDINNNKILADAKTIYLVQQSNKYKNIFPVNCTAQKLPALEYIFVSHYFFLPNQLMLNGITNIKYFKGAPPDNLKPQFQNKFWRVYRDGENAYIIFKKIDSPAMICHQTE